MKKNLIDLREWERERWKKNNGDKPDIAKAAKDLKDIESILNSSEEKLSSTKQTRKEIDQLDRELTQMEREMGLRDPKGDVIDMESRRNKKNEPKNDSFYSRYINRPRY